MGRYESDWLQQAIVEELKQGEKKSSYLMTKYQLTQPQLRNIMDTVGYVYAVYNPVPGKWAILGSESDND